MLITGQLLWDGTTDMLHALWHDPIAGHDNAQQNHFNHLVL